MAMNRLFVIVLGCCVVSSMGQAQDWPHWRGPNHNGISSETDIDTAALNDPKIVWQAELGIGFSAVSIAEGKAYVMGNVDKNKDIVYCFDALTGKEVWRYEYIEPLDPKYYEGGTSATPTVHAGKVYTLSKSGKLFCFDAQTGAIVWQKVLPHKAPTWGFASSGIVLDDNILFNVGSAGLALNKNDGQIVWDSAATECGYATPVPFKTPDGRQLIALFAKESLIAVDPADGKMVWDFPWKTQHYVNAADPIIAGQEAFITSGYNHGAALVRFAETPTAVWQDKSMRSQMSGPVRIGDCVYGIDQNQLACVEWATGKQLWAEPKVGNGTLSAVGTALIVLSERGRLMFVAASPDGFTELSGAEVLPGGRCWTMPVLSGGHLYARNSQGKLVCIDVRKK